MTEYRISIIVDGQDNASGQLGKVSSALGTMGTVAGGILSADLLRNIGQEVLNLGKEAIDSYKSYESLGLALQSLVAKEMVNTGAAKSLTEAMGGASEKASALQSWIQKLAVQSPFTQQGVADAFKTAMAYGFATDEAKRLTGAMIDFSAGSGQSEASMSRIALALGQIKAKGQLAGGEVLQLTEAGLAVNDILARQFGKSTSEIVKMREKGLIPANEAIEAIIKSMEEDFGGAAKRQTNTFSGLLSTISDIKSVGLREFFTGVFKEAQPIISDVVDKLSSEEFMGSLRQAGEDLAKWGKPLFDIADGLIKATESGGAFEPILSRIKILFDDGFSVSERLRIALGGIVSPEVLAGFIGLAEAVGGFGQAFVNSLPMIQQYGLELWNFLVNTVSQLAPQFLANITSLLMTISDIWRDHGDEIMGIVNSIISILIIAVTGAISFASAAIAAGAALINGIVKAFGAILEGDWSAAWEYIKTYALQAWEILKATFISFMEMILGTMGTNMAAFTSTWSNNWNMAKTIASTVWTMMVSTISTAISNIRNTVVSKVEEIKSTWENNWNMAKTIVETVWTNIKNIVFSKISQVVIDVQTKAEELKNVVETKINAVKNIWNGIFEEMYNTVHDVSTAIGDVINAAKSLFDWASKNVISLKIGVNGGGSRSIPQLAVGGNVWAGQQYIVGERGPELFTATQNGQITPNHAMNTWNVTINHPQQSEQSVKSDLRLVQYLAGA